MQPLFRYGLDLTGSNPDNFVGDEKHVLSDRRNRAVVTKAGPFYADNVVMVDMADLRILVRGIDYVPIELNQIMSLRTGKDVFGALLVINRQVSKNIQVSYQCVGGEWEQTAQTLFDLLDKIPDDGLDFSWYEIDGKPKEWFPTPHFHPIGTPSGFEEICHKLDKIQNAISYTDLPAYKNLILYINSIIDEINQKNKYKMDAFFGPQLIAFKRQINTAFFGLDNLSNYGIATEEDGRIIARSDSITKNFPVAKYIALNSLIAFKNVLYNTFILSETTHIGLTNTTNVSPDADSILNLRTGAIRTLVSKAQASAGAAGINLSIYPTDVGSSEQFVITKISGNKDNRGGIYFLIERTGKKFYIVKHSSGEPEIHFTHLRIAMHPQFEDIENRLIAHINDVDNGHDTTKSQVGLGLVENLPIISVQEILCLDNARKYVTFDLFLLFVKTFFIGKNEGDDEDRNGEVNPIEQLDIFKCNTGVLEPEDPCCPTPPEPCPECPPPAPPPPEVVTPVYIKIDEYCDIVGNNDWHDVSRSLIGRYGIVDGMTFDVPIHKYKDPSKLGVEEQEEYYYENNYTLPSQQCGFDIGTYLGDLQNSLTNEADRRNYADLYSYLKPGELSLLTDYDSRILLESKTKYFDLKPGEVLGYYTYLMDNSITKRILLTSVFRHSDDFTEGPHSVPVMKTLPYMILSENEGSLSIDWALTQQFVGTSILGIPSGASSDEYEIGEYSAPSEFVTALLHQDHTGPFSEFNDKVTGEFTLHNLNIGETYLLDSTSGVTFNTDFGNVYDSIIEFTALSKDVTIPFEIRRSDFSQINSFESYVFYYRLFNSVEEVYTLRAQADSFAITFDNDSYRSKSIPIYVDGQTTTNATLYLNEDTGRLSLTGIDRKKPGYRSHVYFLENNNSEFISLIDDTNNEVDVGYYLNPEFTSLQTHLTNNTRPQVDDEDFTLENWLVWKKHTSYGVFDTVHGQQSVGLDAFNSITKARLYKWGEND